MYAISIKLTLDEIFPLTNILNEACNGIHIVNFENKIKAKEEAVVSLLHKILKIYDELEMFSKNTDESNTASEIDLENDLSLKLTNFDLTILVNSCSEVCKQIDDWEFPIRIGVSKQEVSVIINKLINEFDVQKRQN